MASTKFDRFITEHSKTVGERIKHLRQKYNFTLEEVGKKISVSKQTLYKYENGIITNIPSDKIEMLSVIFHVSPSYIMGWDSSIKSSDSLTLTLQEENMVKKYRCLTPEGKETVDTILDLQYKAVAPKVKSETAG
jgi:transcriptional regulator with XRE-family HTH domain